MNPYMEARKGGRKGERGRKGKEDSTDLPQASRNALDTFLHWEEKSFSTYPLRKGY